uniref:Transmembrane gamma-carboxyglutamic acid protein 4-like n=1 Tax=Sinocyclocheilus grahami TaxID=75366 RepID=A0A672RNM8_SINGR
MLIFVLLLCHFTLCGHCACVRKTLQIPADQDIFKHNNEGESQSKVDVTTLLVGIISAGVFIVIVGLVIWYFCFTMRCVKRRSTRSNASVIIRRLEEVSLHRIPHTGSDSNPDAHALPSYEQAIAINGPHDAPPPPYPGYQHAFSFDLFPYVISLSFLLHLYYVI